MKRKTEDLQIYSLNILVHLCNRQSLINHQFSNFRVALMWNRKKKKNTSRTRNAKEEEKNKNHKKDI